MDETGVTNEATATSATMDSSQTPKTCHISKANCHGVVSAPNATFFGPNDNFARSKSACFAPTSNSHHDTSSLPPKNSRAAPTWFPSVEVVGGPGQIHLNDRRTNTYWSISDHDLTFYQRHVDSNVPCGWHCGVPVYLVSGARCDPNLHRPCYALPPLACTGSCCSRPVDPGLVYPRPSPAPTLSDCTTFSEPSTTSNGPHDTRIEQPFASSSNEAIHARTMPAQQEYVPSMQFPVYRTSAVRSSRAVQPSSLYPLHTWDYQGMNVTGSRIGDPSRTCSYATAGPGFAPVTGADISSRATSLTSVQSSNDGILNADHLQAADNSSYPIAPRPFSATESQEARPPKKTQPWKRRQAVKKTSPRKTSQSKRSARRVTSKDSFLIQSKAAGMSYKAIKANGNFTEAVSTLRGRYRTLTKAKEKRVRCPRWTSADVSLLKEAVEALNKGDGARRRAKDKAEAQETGPEDVKVSWRAVADYIHSQGGSYLFGVATCRKKWDEVNGE